MQDVSHPNAANMAPRDVICFSLKETYFSKCLDYQIAKSIERTFSGEMIFFN